ncbi:transposase-like protein [Bradyrhizobium barranii subsp. barranii]
MDADHPENGVLIPCRNTLALQHGVNANLLRKWVAKRQRQNGDGQPEAPIAPAFVPVRAPSPSPTRSAGAIAVCATERSCAGRLTASMPNGVTLSLEGGDAQLLSAVIEALGRCDVPAGV